SAAPSAIGALRRRDGASPRSRSPMSSCYDPRMKITALEHLHADAGQRNFDFLKISTDDGLVGWSEYNESFGGLGVSAVIDGLSSQIVGADPRAYEAIVTRLYAVRRQAAGGVVQQAIGAV